MAFDEESGSEAFHCRRCGSSTNIQSIPATGYDWGEPEWRWADDGKSAVLTVTCKKDSTHVLTPEVTITGVVTSQVTESENGKMTYTATAQFNGQTYTSVNAVVILATGTIDTDGTQPPKTGDGSNLPPGLLSLSVRPPYSCQRNLPQKRNNKQKRTLEKQSRPV